MIIIIDRVNMMVSIHPTDSNWKGKTKYVNVMMGIGKIVMFIIIMIGVTLIIDTLTMVKSMKIPMKFVLVTKDNGGMNAIPSIVTPTPHEDPHEDP